MKAKKPKLGREVFLVLGILLILALIIFGFDKIRQWFSSRGISSFEECVAAGYPVMESYPRQCAAGGRTFVEQLG